MTRRFWTDAERDYLRRHYADTPTPEIARALGRSEKTVYTTARDLGLRKAPHYMRQQHGTHVRTVGEATRAQRAGWYCSDREPDGCAEWRREHEHEMRGSAKR